MPLAPAGRQGRDAPRGALGGEGAPSLTTRRARRRPRGRDHRGQAQPRPLCRRPSATPPPLRGPHADGQVHPHAPPHHPQAAGEGGGARRRRHRRRRPPRRSRGRSPRARARVAHRPGAARRPRRGGRPSRHQPPRHARLLGPRPHGRLDRARGQGSLGAVGTAHAVHPRADGQDAARGERPPVHGGGRAAHHPRRAAPALRQEVSGWGPGEGLRSLPAGVVGAHLLQLASRVPLGGVRAGADAPLLLRLLQGSARRPRAAPLHHRPAKGDPRGAMCERCGQALTAAEAKSGRYTYYVCQSLLKRGKGACDTPRLNAKRFEATIIGQIRDHILTESNIRDLVRMLDEEMDGVAHEQRERLESLELELAEERKKLDRVWRFVESTDLDCGDASERIREHRERQQQLELAAEEARAVLAERRDLLDNADTIAAFAKDMSAFLRTSEITETRAFVRSFVKQVLVGPGQAVIHYTLPTPQDSPIRGADAAKFALPEGFMRTKRGGRPDWTKSRTGVSSRVTPSEGIGIVYVSVASLPVTSMPFTKLRMSAFRSGIVPSHRKLRKSATYRLISSVEGSSTLRCASWASASSRAAASWSSRCRNSRIRGDSASRVRSLFSRAS
ncbi:MAG: hypothetical protein F4Z77_09860 [Dehalococcoidia bacterium]|nr:hypothetical protein [Dehalococcoidia bacterium]MYA53011.1 hypothetical protein [Dehalococcoidia bacterium]